MYLLLNVQMFVGATTLSTAVVGGPVCHYYGKLFIFQPNFISVLYIHTSIQLTLCACLHEEV